MDAGKSSLLSGLVIASALAAGGGLRAQSYSAFDLGDQTLGGGINSGGTVVGFDRADHEVFTYQNGLATEFGSEPLPNASGVIFDFGINDAGTVAGYITPQSGSSPLAVTYSGGVMTQLGTLPGGTESFAAAINQAGTVAGWSNSSGGSISAVTFSNGAVTDLGTLPGGSTARANGINDEGEVVGSAKTAAGDGNAFLYSDGAMQDIGTLGGTLSNANAINDDGTIVGYSDPAGSSNYHAFSFVAGAMADLGTLGGAESSAWAISAAGQIVGWADTAAGDSHGFIYNSNGGMIDLNSLVSIGGVVLTVATGINDIGEIVANGSNGHAYLLAPIPEPPASAAILGLIGLAVVLARRRRAAA